MKLVIQEMEDETDEKVKEKRLKANIMNLLVKQKSITLQPSHDEMKDGMTKEREDLVDQIINNQLSSSYPTKSVINLMQFRRDLKNEEEKEKNKPKNQLKRLIKMEREVKEVQKTFTSIFKKH